MVPLASLLLRVKLTAILHFSGLNVTALIMIFLWVPETKQRTLEELDYIFGVPTIRFVRYQCTEALPWWFKRYILFRKDAQLRPLYKLAIARAHKDEDKE